MDPYNASSKSEIFFFIFFIKAGVRGAGVIRAILKREYHVYEKLSFFRNLVYSILSMYPFLLNHFLTKTISYSAQFETGVIKAGVKGAGVRLGSAL